MKSSDEVGKGYRGAEVSENSSMSDSAVVFSLSSDWRIDLSESKHLMAENDANIPIFVHNFVTCPFILDIIMISDITACYTKRN